MPVTMLSVDVNLLEVDVTTARELDDKVAAVVSELPMALERLVE